MKKSSERPCSTISHAELLSPIDQIEIVALKANDSQLSATFLNEIEPNLASISDFLGITAMQSVLLSVIIAMNLQSDIVAFADIARYFDLNGISLARYEADITVLLSRHFIELVSSDERRRFREKRLNACEYYVNKKFYDALQRNELFIPEPSNDLDVFSLLKRIKQLILHKNDYLSESGLMIELSSLLDKNMGLGFVHELRLLDLDDESLLFYLFICSEFADDPNANIDLPEVIGQLYDSARNNIQIRRLFLNEEHPLQKLSLLELEKDFFRGDAQVLLTEKSWEMMLGDDNGIVMKKKIPSNKYFRFVPNAEIVEKRLQYSFEEQKEIDFITNSLMPDNYELLTERLREKALPAGLCILFYGEAGTSKTQLCYTIAKKTGRDILDFRLSAAKSMYYGESQKEIKRAFDQYRDIVSHSTVAPIFLMNEADGIISKRMSSSPNPAVMQTENAIQAIILNELESLDGILIATTNLQDNFDSSFYRRFLVKKRFQKPSREIRKLIWADKMPWLTEEQVGILSNYEITGAIIENCQRKLLIENLLHAQGNPSLDLIINWLEEEAMAPSVLRNTVGFRH